mmetsp:Transcript_3585/g.7911  ORF Transcript_3585/g.7911 Transcript_3585/m.7911 type:complete len:160 (+) Transcript_3585:546-1025(+)
MPPSVSDAQQIGLYLWIHQSTSQALYCYHSRRRPWRGPFAEPTAGSDVIVSFSSAIKSNRCHKLSYGWSQPLETQRASAARPSHSRSWAFSLTAMSIIDVPSAADSAVFEHVPATAMTTQGNSQFDAGCNPGNCISNELPRMLRHSRRFALFLGCLPQH